MYNNSPQVKSSAFNTDASKGGNICEPFRRTCSMTKGRNGKKKKWTNHVRYYKSYCVHNILKKYQEDFFEFPAAKRHHHAFVGGLSFHTVSMLRLAKAIATYSQINRSLILHDIGKTMEQAQSGWKLHIKGNYLAILWLWTKRLQACEELDIDENQEGVLLLKHLILAHRRTWIRSPVRPQLLNGSITPYRLIRCDDYNDVKMHSMELNQAHSQSVYSVLDNCSFYKPSSNGKN